MGQSSRDVMERLVTGFRLRGVASVSVYIIIGVDGLMFVRRASELLENLPLPVQRCGGWRRHGRTLQTEPLLRAVYHRHALKWNK